VTEYYIPGTEPVNECGSYYGPPATTAPGVPPVPGLPGAPGAVPPVADTSHPR